VSLFTALKSAVGVRGLGCIPDPPDARDRGIGELLAGLSTPPDTSSDLLGCIPSVLDQGSTNACNGYAWGQGLRCEMLADEDPAAFLPSPHAIYAWARAFAGLQGRDVGSILRDAPRALKQFGFPPESAWPSHPRSVNVMPGPRAFHEAHDRRKLANYYRIPRGDIESLKLTIASRHPVVFGLQVSRSFLDGNEDTVDRGSGKALGGHAMLAVSYERERVLAVSSYGRLWRRNGFVWISTRRMAEAMDAWACALKPH
jgi:hypothetical protein